MLVSRGYPHTCCKELETSSSCCFGLALFLKISKIGGKIVDCSKQTAQGLLQSVVKCSRDMEIAQYKCIIFITGQDKERNHFHHGRVLSPVANCQS